MKKSVNKKKNYYLRMFQRNKLLFTITIIISLITSAGSSLIALLLKNLVDITEKGDQASFFSCLIQNLCFMAGFAVFYYISSLLSKILMRNIIRNARGNIFYGIFRRNYQEFHKVNTADYISALTNDIKIVEENYILAVFEVIQNLMVFAFALVLLLIISPLITLLLFISLVLMVLIPGIIGQQLQAKQEQLSGKYSEFTARIKDMLSGFEVVKSYHMFDSVMDQFRQENEDLASKKFRTDKLFVLSETTSQFLGVFSQVFTIFVGAFLVMTGKISMGSLIAIMQLSGVFIMPLIAIMNSLPKLQSVAPIMKRLQELEDYEDTTNTGTHSPSFKRDIKISGLSFGYEEEQKVLENVTLNIERGKKYAIVGESGCGKSTLVKLIAGYYSGYEGTISFDYNNLMECDRDQLNSLISIIHQNVYMFDKSIKDNICLSKDYTQEALNKALRLSGVDKFLPMMKEGIDTLVGENGSNLSGGQRQRIAIARALIKGTPILILDEGTSAIDLQTSYDIEQNLLDNQELTLITITHRLDKEQLGQYDEIIYMDQGRIVERGSYQDLVNNKNKFYQFCIA